MGTDRTRRGRARACTLLVASALGGALAGCGGSSTHSAAAGAAASTGAGTSASTTPGGRTRPTGLSIVAPKAGARTGETLAVRVRVTGAGPAGASPLRYVLDRSHARRGPSDLTLHGLAPGGHELVVMLAGDAAVQAHSFFIVRAPKPRSASAAETKRATDAARPAPAAPAPIPPGAGAEQPSPQPEPPPASKAPPSAATGIPQGGAGDGDSDNSGAPSDGDGNV